MGLVKHRVVTVALAGLLGSACVESIEPDAPESTPAAEEQLGTQEFFVLYDFEGGFDATTGEFTIERIEVPDNSPLDMGGLGIVENALWCGLRVVADGAAGTNPNDSIEIYTFPASIQFAAPPAAPPASCLAAGGNTGLYGILGVFCADVRVMNFFGTALTDVHVAIDFVGDDVNYGPYAGGLGTSVAPPSGMSASLIGIPALDAVWSYGNLDARGGAATASTETWTFRYAAAGGSFRFRGKVVSRISENCATTIDDDCDGVVNNGCGTFITGAPCVANNDCVSNYCNAGFCAGNPCADGVFNGTETDLDCGGAFCGATCLPGDDCDTGADCVSGACRGPLGSETCRADVMPTAPGSIVFTEVQVEPGDNAQEWFEVKNTTGADLNLSGCSIRERTSGGGENTWNLGEIAIPAGSYHVLVEPGAVGAVTASFPLGSWTQFTTSTGFSLQEPVDYLRLVCGATEIDRIDWSSTAPSPDNVNTGRSLILDGRVLTSTGNDDAFQFCSIPGQVGYQYVAGQYGTPGVANPNCADFNVGYCNIQFPTARPETGYSGSTLTYYGRLYIAFLTDMTTGNDTNTRVRAQVHYGATGTDPATWDWSTAVAMAANPLWAPLLPDQNNDEYMGALSIPATVGTTYDVAVRFSGNGGTSWTYCDVDGNDIGNGGSNGYSIAQSGQFIVQPPIPAPTAGEVVISEVMANGRAIGATSTEYEYVELYNTTGSARSLAGCVLRETQSSVVNHTIDWATSSVIPAGGYVVITTSSTTPGFSYQGRTGALAINNGAESVTLVCGGTDISTIAFSGDQDVDLYAIQLDPSRLASATGNDATVSWNGGTWLSWWCSTPSVGGSNSFTSPDGVMYGTPGAANPPCLSVDYCRLDSPTNLGEVGTGTSHTVNGQYYSANLTPLTTGVESHHMLRAEVGLGPNGSTDPNADAGWTWSTAAAIAGWVGAGGSANNDGFSASITAPATANESRDYAFRFSGRNGVAGSWTYCDAVNGGSNGSVDGYQAANAGAIATPRYWTINYCDLNWPTPNINSGGGTARAGNQVTAYGVINVPGLTDLAPEVTPSANVIVQFGYGADGSARSSWTYANAAPNGGFFDFFTGEDEYQYTVTIPSANGAPYDYGFRASGDGGTTWTDCFGTGDMPVASYTIGWGDDATSNFTGIPGGRFTVNGQTWPNAGAPPSAPNVDAWADYGIGPAGTTPLTNPGDWTWTRATYNGVTGNDWLFTNTMSLPAQASYPATLKGVWRFTANGGASYYYADLDNSAGGSFNDMATFTVLAPAAGDLVITEVMANPTALADSVGEWFEVYNAKSYALNLRSVLSPSTLESSVPFPFTVATDLIIPANGYLVFANTAGALDKSGDSTPSPDYVYPSGFFLGNSTDTLTLTLAGVDVDTVSWNTSPFPSQAAGGFSIQTTSTSADNSIGANWCASTTRWDGLTSDFGTPRAANPACVVSTLGAGALIITEIYYGDTVSTGFEAIEVYNASGVAIDLAATQVEVVDNDGTILVLDPSDWSVFGGPSGTSLAAGAYGIFGNEAVVLNALVQPTPWNAVRGALSSSVGGAVTSTAWISDTGEVITLRNASDDSLIDTVDGETTGWGYSAALARSLILDGASAPNATTNNGQAAWCHAASSATSIVQGANGTCAETCTLGGSNDDDNDGETACLDSFCSGNPSCVAAGTPDLLITEYIEGTSNNKAIEITVMSGTVNFATASCQVELYANGGTTPTTQALSSFGTLSAGAAIVLYNSAATAAFKPSGSIASTTTNYNGDDGLVVRCNGTIIDSMGQLGVDPGAVWAGTPTTINLTLRRNCGAAADADFSNAFSMSTSSWTSFAIDTADGLGTAGAAARNCPTAP